MDELNEILTLVMNVGFPAVLSFYLLRYMQHMDERHDAEVSKLRDIVERNTEALISLKESIIIQTKKDGS